MSLFDVTIIGGGPAGLATGISLARAGFKTLLFEKGRFPIDKPCGEGIMPPGVSILKELGVLDKIPNWEARQFEGIYTIFPGGHLAQTNFSEGPGLALRRPILSKALLEVASNTPGLTIEENTTASIENSNSRWVIGADGLHSPTRKHLGLEGPASKLKRYGTVQHYAVKPWNSKVEIHWARGVEAYITPCGDQEIGVAFLWDKNRFELQATGKSISEGFLAAFPNLKERLASAPKIGVSHSVGPFYQPTKRVTRGRFALIGDAAGYLDPLTGEGISLGLKSAQLLTRCLSAGKDLTWYEQELHKSRRSYSMTTHTLLFLARHEGLLNLSSRLLTRYPALFQKLLSLNMGV